MKATGIVRRIDELGRIVIPKEIRRTMGLAEGDPMEIFVDSDQIVLRKYQPGCIFCGESESMNIKVVGMYGKIVCRRCVNQIINSISYRS